MYSWLIESPSTQQIMAFVNEINSTSQAQFVKDTAVPLAPDNYSDALVIAVTYQFTANAILTIKNGDQVIAQYGGATVNSMVGLEFPPLVWERLGIRPSQLTIQSSGVVTVQTQCVRFVNRGGLAPNS